MVLLAMIGFELAIVIYLVMVMWRFEYLSGVISK